MSQNTQSLNQTTSYAHWIAFFYLHAHIKIFNNLSCWKSEKKDWAKWARILQNTLIDEQLCSQNMLSCICLLKHISEYLFIYRIWNQKKKRAKWAKWARMLKTPSQMSSYAHEHVFLYLHAQTNINTLLYWSYTKS